MTFYSGCKVFCRPLLRCAFSIRVTGLEHMPQQGRVILCSNHRRLSDPPILGCVMNRPVRYMAKSELFTDHGRAAAYFLKKFGAFPVKRDSADRVSLQIAVSLLEQEQVVGIFPEGGCVKPGTPFEAKVGVTMLARRTKAPILPVWMEYGQKSSLRQPVQIRIGRLIPYEELSSPLQERKNTRDMTAYLTDVMNVLGGI